MESQTLKERANVLYAVIKGPSKGSARVMSSSLLLEM